MIKKLKEELQKLISQHDIQLTHLKDNNGDDAGLMTTWEDLFKIAAHFSTIDIYVIEKMIVPGIWELLSPRYYTSTEEAEDEMNRVMNGYKNKFNMKVDLRVTKLETSQSTKQVMKSNEAPEKIDIQPNAHNVWSEITSTDAFIEKAERYIRSVADGLDRDDDVEAFISEFRKYMKGD